MNRERLFLIIRPVFVLIASLAVLLAIGASARRVSAQKNASEQKNGHRAASPTTANATSETGTNAADDNDYSKKIKEYTTEPYFRTELVDHLPMSDQARAVLEILRTQIDALFADGRLVGIRAAEPDTRT